MRKGWKNLQELYVSYYTSGLNCVIQKIICASVSLSFWGINHQVIASVGWKDQGVYVKSGIFEGFARWRLLFGPLYDVLISYEIKG